MRVLNRRYWPHQIPMPKIVKYITDTDPRETWCKENLKPSQWKAYGWADPVFAFKHADDAVMFKLRWM